LLNAIRLQETVYKSAGTVHGCALFIGDAMKLYVEDVGRHNAVDVIAGWLWMNDIAIGDDAVFYTTGRLTSEMVLKSAQMGIGVVVSRNGITQMGYDLAQRLGLCAIGRAKNKHYLVYTEHARVLADAAVVM
jgi:FdhD protein